MTAYPSDTDDPITDLPFPLASFPPTVADWLETTAAQVRVPVEFVAFPFLAFTGAVLGNQVSLQVAPGWTEWPTLWVALVAPTGHGKTPAIAAARAPFTTLHGVGSDYEAETDAILDELDAEREAMRRSLQQAETEPPPLATFLPEPADTGVTGDPDPSPFFTASSEWDDTGFTGFDDSESAPLFTATSRIDALVGVLSLSCGLCLLRDELASLIHTIDRGRAEDHQALLSLWSAEPIYPLNPELSPLLHPVLAIVGGLQPRLFPRFRSAAQDGLLERFLVVYPAPARIARHDLATASLDPAPIVSLVETLRPIDAVQLRLAPAAADAWRDWFRLNSAEAEAAGPTLEGFYRKVPAHAARLALILHALWHPTDLEEPVSGHTLNHAICLAEFLRPYARRTAASLGERRPALSAAAELTQRILLVLRVEAGWVPRTHLRQLLGRPEISRFNRVLATLVDNEDIEVSRETHPGSRKPVTLYRLPQGLGGSHGVHI